MFFAVLVDVVFGKRKFSHRCDSKFGARASMSTGSKSALFSNALVEPPPVPT